MLQDEIKNAVVDCGQNLAHLYGLRPAPAAKNLVARFALEMPVFPFKKLMSSIILPLE
jgi:hypothetical protein